MRFIKKIILSFCMVSVLLGSMPLCVYANDLNDGENDGYDRFMGGHNIEGFNTWDATDKKSFTFANIGSFFASIGMYFKGMSNENLMDILIDHLIESGRIKDAESTDEYIASHLTANKEETELYLSSDFTNALYETSVQYIEENSGFRVHDTVHSTEYASANISKFKTKDQERAFLNYCAENTDTLIITNGLFSNFANCYAPDSEESVTLIDGLEIYTVDLKDTEFYYSIGSYGVTSVYSKNSNWEDQTRECHIIGTDGIVYSCSTRSGSGTFTTVLTGYNRDKSNYRYYEYKGIPKNVDLSICVPIALNITNSTYTVTHGGQSIRIYDSFDDLKQYSVGQRPYYVGDKFVNYDSSIDNSTTITQTEIDNSITYGDVYNYIINNYDNPDGLTEEELIAILEKYLGSLDDNDDGSGSGSGDSGSGGSDDDDSGGGLLDFLSGLGSIGDALLSIIGKLLEYIGKAIDLIVNGLAGIIEKVPVNVTGLIGALFPFLPEEFLWGVELALILGVVCIVIKIFK